MEVQAICNILSNSLTEKVIDHNDDFLNFARTAPIGILAASEIAKWTHDYRTPPNLSGPSSLNLLAGNWWAIDLAKFKEAHFSDRFVTALGDGVFYFLTPARIKLYSIQNYNNKIFTKDARAQLKVEVDILAGDSISIDADREALEIIGAKPVLALTLFSKKSKSFCWTFDSKTGIPVSYFNNFAVQTVLELAARFLGTYSDKSSIDCLTELLEHESDSIKWHAANAILKIDVNQGKRAFTRLQSSKSPMLADSANRTLTLLEGV